MSRLVVVDTETTGLVPAARYPIFEIAIIVIDDGQEVGDKCWWMPVELSDADPSALRLNRYYERQPKAEDKTPRATVAQEVARWTANATLAGFNVSFDAERLDLFLRSEGLAPAWHYRLYEVESAAAAVLGVQPQWPSSTTLMAELGVEGPEETRHTAMGDARLAWAAYRAVYGLDKPVPKPRRPARALSPKALAQASAAPQPEQAEGEADPTEAADPAPAGRTIARGVPKGMPAEGDSPSCEACGDLVELEQARFSWSRHRRILCRKDFGTAKVT